MTAHDDAKIAEILGYSAEVCEPDSKPITAYYTSRHLDPVRKRLVEYVESVRADERERLADLVQMKFSMTSARSHDDTCVCILCAINSTVDAAVDFIRGGESGD